MTWAGIHFQQIFIFGWAVQNKIQCSLHLIQKKVEFHSLCFCILVNIFLSVNDTWMFLRIPGFSESRGHTHCCLCCPISLAFLCTVLPTTVASLETIYIISCGNRGSSDLYMWRLNGNQMFYTVVHKVIFILLSSLLDSMLLPFLHRHSRVTFRPSDVTFR